VFSEHYERQFIIWKKFRNKLEKNSNPFLETINFWSLAPLVNKHLDIYRYNDWPTPWEIIKEGKYDELTKVLMMGHTLNLTERFSKDNIEIKTYLDSDKKVVYNVCSVQNKLLNYPYGEMIEENELPKNLILQTAIPLPNYN